MSNPKSDSAPDIFFNWADALMIQYARADVSAPLDEYMEKDPELKDNFLPSILDAAKVDGKYYGIPVRGVQPIVLFYNKKVLSDNGIEAPTTFDEFCDACEKLKSAGLTPIALGGGDQWPTLNWYSVIYQQVMGNDDVQKMMDGGGARPRARRRWRLSATWSKRDTSALRTIRSSTPMAPPRLCWSRGRPASS